MRDFRRDRRHLPSLATVAIACVTVALVLMPAYAAPPPSPAPDRRALLARPESAARVLEEAAGAAVSAERFRALVAQVPAGVVPGLDTLAMRLEAAAEDARPDAAPKLRAILARWPHATVWGEPVAAYVGTQLAEAGDAGTARALLDAARGRHVRTVPVSWGAALVAMGGAADRPALRALLRDPRPDRRAMAAIGLHGHGDARDLPALIAATRDRQAAVARRALSAVLDLMPAGRRAELPAIVGQAHRAAAEEGRAWLALPPASPAPPARFEPAAGGPAAPLPAAGPAPTAPALQRLAHDALEGDIVDRARHAADYLALVRPAHVPVLWQAAERAGPERADHLAALAACAPPADLPRLRAALLAEPPSDVGWRALAAVGTPDDVPAMLTRGAARGLTGRAALAAIGGPAARVALAAELPREPRALLPLLLAGGHPSDGAPLQRMLATYATWKVADIYLNVGVYRDSRPAEGLWLARWRPWTAWLDAWALDALRAARRLPDARLAPALYPLLDRAAFVADEVHATLAAAPYDRDEAGLARAERGAIETLAARLALLRAARLVRQGQAARAAALLDALAGRPVVVARPSLAARVGLARAEASPPSQAEASLEALARRAPSAFASIDHLRFPDLAARLALARAEAALAAGKSAQALEIARGQFLGDAPAEALAVAWRATRHLDKRGPAGPRLQALDAAGRRATALRLGAQLRHLTSPDDDLRTPYFQESNASMGGDMDQEAARALSLALEGRLADASLRRFADEAWEALKLGGTPAMLLLSR